MSGSSERKRRQAWNARNCRSKTEGSPGASVILYSFGRQERNFSSNVCRELGCKKGEDSACFYLSGIDGRKTSAVDFQEANRKSCS